MTQTEQEKQKARKLKLRYDAMGDVEVFLNRAALDRTVQAKVDAARTKRERRKIILTAMFREHAVGKQPVWW